MVQDDAPIAEGLKILDFGLAKIKSGELLGSFVQAQTSGLMGSPFYMAPEQWSDDEPDARADIYSLGVILYQMLAGEVPFKGSSIPSIMKKHLTMPPPSFQSMGVSIPPAIEAVVRHSLEKEVEARIDSVATFLKELDAAMNAAPIVASSRETAALDPNQTIASVTPASASEQPPGLSGVTQPPLANQTNFGSSFDSMAGTVSGAQLDKILDKPGSERQDDARARVAEMNRHAEARKIAEETERRQREEQERSSKEKQERDRREQEQQDKLERMARQAKDLEDRLERLSGSMPPATTADPEATHLQANKSSPEWSAGGAPQSVGPGKPMIVDFAPARKGRPLLIIGAALIVLVLVGAGISAYLFVRASSGTSVNANSTPTPEAPPRLSADLLPISGGTFLMGRKFGPPQETPAHPVTVQQFQMDRTEVTNTEYVEFVRETNHAAPSHWAGPKPSFGQELWPVVNVSYEDAEAFAAWRSKRDGVAYRLPTEEEWEYAARNGEQSDLYPWGADWKDNVAVLKEATPAPVDSRAGGKNKWGVADLIGNVWEWTSSKVSVYPGNPVIVPNSTQDWITIRGGCYVSDPAKSDAPVSACMREFVPPSTKTTLLGFRLVRSRP
jgi:formylglycine-generating enzyme required for sulfatase activity